MNSEEKGTGLAGTKVDSDIFNYDVLETGKLSLEELAPRIRELRIRQDELSKTRIQIEGRFINTGCRRSGYRYS